MAYLVVLVNSQNISTQALQVLLQCGYDMKTAWKTMEDAGCSHYEGTLLFAVGMAWWANEC